LNRFAMMAEQMRGPEWSFREASMAQRKLDDARALVGYQARQASQPMQYVSAYDSQAARAAQLQRDSLLNYLNGQGNMALGGLVATGVMLSTNNVVAASATTDAVAPLDNLLAPMGGPQATRLASTGRRGPLSSSGAAGDLDWTRISPRTGGDAAAHVMENHGSLSFTKPNQGVFYGDPVTTIEDAWRIAQGSGLAPMTAGNRDYYVVPRPNSGYAGGMGGQLENFNHVTIITEAGTTRVVTGYPSGGTPPLPKGYTSLFGSP
jgi:hypothetical protein